MAKKTIIILGLVILILIIGLVILKLEKEQVLGKISFEEKGLIETWILENNLNQYGDSKDTFYAGGTPLFNEFTGGSLALFRLMYDNVTSDLFLERKYNKFLVAFKTLGLRA